MSDTHRPESEGSKLRRERELADLCQLAAQYGLQLDPTDPLTVQETMLLQIARDNPKLRGRFGYRQTMHHEHDGPGYEVWVRSENGEQVDMFFAEGEIFPMLLVTAVIILGAKGEEIVRFRPERVLNRGDS